MSSNVLHRTGRLIVLSISMIVFNLTQVTVLVLVLFVRLFMNVGCIVLDIFCPMSVLESHTAMLAKPLTLAS